MRYPILVLIGILCVMSCINPEHKKKGASMELESLPEEVTDSSLAQQLKLLGIKDQTLRLLLPEVASKFGSGSPQESYFWSLIHEQDSINEKEIHTLLEKYGWLGKSRIGSEANQSLWLIIQHAPLEVQEKYLPLLRESVTQQESEGWHLAFLEDRVLMRNHKKQRYGSQAKWDEEAQKMRIHDIEDVANVNKRRAELGLESVEEFAKANDYLFDQNP